VDGHAVTDAMVGIVERVITHEPCDTPGIVNRLRVIATEIGDHGLVEALDAAITLQLEMRRSDRE
jgi:hypothetical protein